MAELVDCLNVLKTEKPELSNFLTKFESYMSNDIFNSSAFENAVKNGLKKKEEEITTTFNKIENAQNQ